VSKPPHGTIEIATGMMCDFHQLTRSRGREDLVSDSRAKACSDAAPTLVGSDESAESPRVPARISGRDLESCTPVDLTDRTHHAGDVTLLHGRLERRVVQFAERAQRNQLIEQGPGRYPGCMPGMLSNDMTPWDSDASMLATLISLVRLLGLREGLVDAGHSWATRAS